MQQLHAALMSAFDHEALERLVRFRMDFNLSQVVGAGQNLETAVFELLVWAQHHGRLEELVRAASQTNPGNADLRNVAGMLAQMPSDAVRDGGPSGTKPAGGATTTLDSQALRRAISRSFNAEELELLCADVQDKLIAEGINDPVSVDAIGGAGQPLDLRVLNLVKYLDRRGRLAFLVDAVRRARPGLI